MMKAYAIQGAFGFENLKLVERAEPTAKAGEVVVGLTAASLNYRDLLMIQGAYNPRQPLPLIPLSDGAGRIEAVGEGVKRVKVGDRVCVLFAQGWLAGEPTRDKIRTTLGGPLDGTLAEKIVLREDGVIRIPSYLSDEEAATLPCAAVTAWHALVGEKPTRPGETVLIQGTGGVSIFALQIAKLLGLRVFATSSSEEKLEKLKALGADEVINYKTTPAWGKAIRDKTGGEGVDQIIEVGGAKTFEQSLRCIKIGGQIAVIGVLSGVSEEISLTSILMQNLRVQGILVGSREHFEQMLTAMERVKMRPVLDKTFAFDQVTEAFDWMAQGKHFGKITIRLS